MKSKEAAVHLLQGRADELRRRLSMMADIYKKTIIIYGRSAQLYGIYTAATESDKKELHGCLKQLRKLHKRSTVLSHNG